MSSTRVIGWMMGGGGCRIGYIIVASDGTVLERDANPVWRIWRDNCMVGREARVDTFALTVTETYTEAGGDILAGPTKSVLPIKIADNPQLDDDRWIEDAMRPLLETLIEEAQSKLP